MNIDELDDRLRDGEVSRETLARFIAADADNSTASICWLENRLEILERTVSRRVVVRVSTA